MSFNDGKQLLVFGLSFAQHDNRKMQQLLRHYDKLPENPGSRAGLFVELNKVARELMADEAAQDQIQQLTDWMTKGGDFPFSVAPAPTSAPAHSSDEARSTQGRHVPFLGVGQGYHGPGRALGGQQTNADTPTWHGVPSAPPQTNLGRQYGRGRTVGGNWEENDDDEGKANEDEHEDEDAMSMDEEDEDMHGHFGDHNPFAGFPGMPGQFRPDGPRPRRIAFSGPGRTLGDPTEQDSATIPANDNGAAGPTHVEGQAANLPQNQPGGLEAEQFNAAAHGLHTQLGLRDPMRIHEDVFPTDPEIDLDDDDYESDLPMDHGEPDDGEEIECPICLEEYPRSRFPRRSTITDFCDHPDKACLNCLDASITAIIERGALHLLACPICPQRLSRRDIKEYANRAVYERYKYLKEQSEIPGHYISCTNPICGGSQPHESEDPKMICNHCEFATCAKHRRPWHEGQTCQEFDLDDAQIERLEEEEATAKLLSSEATSICPKCGQGVTKSDGCDHMRCQCGQEWCYVVSNPPQPPKAS